MILLKLDGSWCFFSCDCNGRDYASLPGNITLSDKDGNLYTVSRRKYTTSFEFLGLRIDLANALSNALDDFTHICQVFSTQMNNTKCNKFLN